MMSLSLFNYKGSGNLASFETVGNPDKPEIVWQKKTSPKET